MSHNASNESTYAVRIRVTGRVQGVFFRGSVEKEARSLGLRGWVRNVADGSVEAVAEGDRESVDRLVAFCRRGPPLAHVHCLTFEARPAEGFSDFQVRY